MKQGRFEHRFVEFIPEVLEEGVLYVSMEHCTVTHKCACGCGREVVTPISPTDWQLTFDGERVSLEPSIGNWAFPCRSHYYIRRGQVRWAGDMSSAEIQRGRSRDRAAKAQHYARKQGSDGEVKCSTASPSDDGPAGDAARKPASRSRWAWLRDLIG